MRLIERWMDAKCHKAARLGMPKPAVFSIHAHLG